MKYIIFGYKGQLGQEFVRELNRRGLEWFGYDYPDFDICDYVSISSIICNREPDIVINCAAYSNVEYAEVDNDTAFKVNVEGVSNLSSICRIYNTKFVHFSSDYIFDGLRNQPGLYKEDDKPNPLNYYGYTKMKSEEVALENSPNCLIFRLSWLYGNSDNNFLAKLEQWRKSSDKLKIVNDEISIPTSVEFVVQMSLMGINNNLSGVYNLTPTGYCSRYEWAKLYFEILEKDVIIYPCSIKEFPSIVTRPKFSAMDNTKIYETLKVEIPHWSSVLEKYLSRLLITSDKQTKVVRKIRYDTGITPIEEDL